MTETAGEAGAAPRGGRMGLVLGLMGALVLGGGGFYAAYSGMLPIGGAGMDAAGGSGRSDANDTAPDTPDPVYVPVEPLTVSLGPGSANRYLRFNAEIEVADGQADAVRDRMPRIKDVLNGYLRAVEVARLEDPDALIRLRAQMLSRLRMVVGKGRVRDLLITEFVLN